MLTCLPRNLKDLATLCATENARFGATAGVRLTVEESGLYRAEATDGRVLGIVRGPWPDPPFPMPDPTDAADVMIAAKDWRGAFDMIPKGAKGDMATLAIASGDRIGEGQLVRAHLVSFESRREVACIEGRFPDVSRVLPSGAPMFRIAVDPWYLAEVLKVAGKLIENSGARRVDLLFYGSQKPMAVLARNTDTGQVFDGLVVPLTTKE